MLLLVSMTSHAPIYSGFQNLHPLTEISRGRFGAGLLLVYDTKKCDHLVAKRISKRNEDSFERQVTLHIRASSHVNVVQFMGLLPSSTTCFQYAMEYFPDGDLRQLVVDDVGLPDVPSKYIFRQVSLNVGCYKTIFAYIKFVYPNSLYYRIVAKSQDTEKNLYHIPCIFYSNITKKTIFLSPDDKKIILLCHFLLTPDQCFPI